MRINHNIAALNTYRQLSSAGAATQKNMAKLSSGLRINNAADDAAGLTISEKMRSQIRGLDQASRNAQDGISLIQTAEGSMNEINSMLQRLGELANQASNGALKDEDRATIQDEVKQLKEEITRTSTDTEYNKMKLIDGTIGGKSVAGTANASVMGTAIGEESAAEVAMTGDVASGSAAGQLSQYTGTSATIVVDGAEITWNHTATDYTNFDDGTNVDTGGLATKLQTDINAAIDEYNTKNNTTISHITVEADAAQDGTLTFKSGSTGATSSIHADVGATGVSNFWEAIGQTAETDVDKTGSEGVFTAAGAASVTAIANSDDARKMTVTVDGKDISVDLATVGASAAYTTGTDMATFATDLQTDLNNAISAYNATVPSSDQVENLKVSIKDGSVVIESGSTNDASSVKFDNSEAAQLLGVANQSSSMQGGGIKFQIGANANQTIQLTIENMSSEALGIGDIDVSTYDGAQAAITAVDKATATVLAQRSKIGAVQNRLEHTVNNLTSTSENLTAADSRIRDVDMAKEMMEFTKNNIINQAAQAMLAQANQQPQQVLQLLR